MTRIRNLTKDEEKKNNSETLYTSFHVAKEDLFKYWDRETNRNPNMRERRFNSHMVAFDWPSMYKNSCVLQITYNHAIKYGSNYHKTDDVMSKPSPCVA